MPLTTPGRRRGRHLALLLAVVWALVAVLLLTGTVRAVRSAQAGVDRIRSASTGLDGDTDAVAAFDRTATRTARLAGTVRPLGPRLAEVADAIRRLEVTAAGLARRTGATAATTPAIRSRAEAIAEVVASLNAGVTGVQAELQGTRANAVAIRSGVAGINQRLAEVTRLVGGLQDTTTQLLREIGPVHGDNLHGHLDSIDCSPLLRLSSSACGR